MEVEEDFSLEYLFQCRNFSLWQRLIYSVSCHVHLLQGNAILSEFMSASLFQEKAVNRQGLSQIFLLCSGDQQGTPITCIPIINCSRVLCQY